MALPLLWTILVITFGLFWLLTRRRTRNPKLAHLKPLPGPKGLPIVGNLFQIGKVPNKQFRKWAKEYGDIYQVKLGNQRTVIISDPKLVKEMFSSDPAFTGRLNTKAFSLYTDDLKLGIFVSEEERWEVHRRFLLRQLRDFGFGKSSMEGLILDELTELIGKYKQKVGTPIGRMRQSIRLGLVNSLWRILASQRLDQDDPELLKLANNVSEKFNEAAATGGILLVFPKLGELIPEWSGYNGIRGVLEDNKEFFQRIVDMKKRNYRDGDQNDFVDVYLAEMKKAENDPKSHFHGKTAERQLVHILFDMFFAGADTTSITLSWAILYICKFPEAQKKLQKELADVTGNSRKVSVDDRPNLPYTMALIDEVLRMSSIVPDGSPHRAIRDAEFHGYLIEDDTLIQPNLLHIHYNPKTWGDPENFRPERFLSPDGKKYVKSENMMAFQIGRRQCAGETMARDSVFLYMTNLFQQFDMKFNPEEKEPPMEGDIGFFRIPQDYSVIMTNRLKN